MCIDVISLVFNLARFPRRESPLERRLRQQTWQLFSWRIPCLTNHIVYKRVSSQPSAKTILILYMLTTIAVTRNVVINVAEPKRRVCNTTGYRRQLAAYTFSRLVIL